MFIFSGLWFLCWTIAPPLLPHLIEPCGGEGDIRGVYHLHAHGHDDRDRSDAMIAAAEARCLDFIVPTEHDDASAGWKKRASPENERDQKPPGRSGELIIIPGVEWSSGDHHLGQIGRGEFRVLNHPTDVGIFSPNDLSVEEKSLLSKGLLGVEAWNAARLWRTPGDRRALALGALLGPARLDLAIAAVSLPGPDLSRWIELQEYARRPLPLLCGSDAHGEGHWPFRETLASLVMHLPPETPKTAAGIKDALQRGRVVCINELMGVPEAFGFARASVNPCRVEVTAELPLGSRWRLLRGTHVVKEGVTSETLSLNPSGVYHLQLWRRLDLGVWGTYERLWGLSSAVFLESTRGRCH